MGGLQLFTGRLPFCTLRTPSRLVSESMTGTSRLCFDNWDILLRWYSMGHTISHHASRYFFMLLISLSLVTFVCFAFVLEVGSKVSCIFDKSVYGLCLLRKDGLLYCFIYLIIDHFLIFGRLRNTKKKHNKEHKTHTLPHYPESLPSYLSSFSSLS